MIEKKFVCDRCGCSYNVDSGTKDLYYTFTKCSHPGVIAKTVNSRNTQLCFDCAKEVEDFITSKKPIETDTDTHLFKELIDKLNTFKEREVNTISEATFNDCIDARKLIKAYMSDFLSNNKRVGVDFDKYPSISALNEFKVKLYLTGATGICNILIFNLNKQDICDIIHEFKEAVKVMENF